jgi:glycosyltransferase involved in cell wall biosynthesis
MIRAVLLPRQDVIIALTTPPYIALAGVLQKIIHPRTRLVLWNMDCYPEAVERTGMIRPGGIVSRMMRAINRAIFRRLDHLVCLDSAMKELLLSQYAPSNRTLPCSIIPNWERADLFPTWEREAPAEPHPGRGAAPAEPCPPQHPRPSAWDNPVVDSLRDRFVILYLGNAGYGHEFKTMLDAAEELRAEPVTFLLVGGGALRPWIAEQAKTRGLANILLCDYVPKEKTRDVMAVADCALITLEDYAAGVMSPSKLHSNLAMGLPVIYVGPKGSNVDEAIERFGCGIRVRPGEGRQVADFIRQMRSNSEQHAALRRRARQAFDEAYCDRRTLPQFDALLERLLPQAERQQMSPVASAAQKETQPSSLA